LGKKPDKGKGREVATDGTTTESEDEESEDDGDGNSEE
jgi:hypothetical protein